MTTSPENCPDTPEGERPPDEPGKGVQVNLALEATVTGAESIPALLWQGFLKIFGSFHLCFGILLFMGLITYLGTRAQAHMSLFDAQVKYFDSWFVIHHVDLPGVGGFQPGLPLPGGMLLMGLLMLNLMVGGLMRIRISKRNVGVVITHLGVILLLVAGFIRYAMGVEGAILVWEGGNSSQFETYHTWEISISTRTPEGKVKRWVIPWGDLADLGPTDSRLFRRDELPFEMEVLTFLPNAQPRRAGRSTTAQIVDGFFLVRRRLEKKNEQNQAGCYLRLMTSKGGDAIPEAILFAGGSRDDAGEVYPFTATFEGQAYEFRLRRETHRLPFNIELADFRAIYYPRTMMPQAYESDVIVREMVDGEPRGEGVPVNISMNRPLRKEGYALYQSSFGPQQRDYNGPMYSVFSVAKNPTDQVPLIACLIIALGMLLHFTQKFSKWVKKEQRKWTA